MEKSTEDQSGIVSDVSFVLDFLRSNGFLESELALKEDIIERSDRFDFEKFLFDLPPVKIPSGGRRRDERGGKRLKRFGSSSDDEFVSLESSTSGVCSSEFTNPYGLHSASQANSETSSDRLSQFGTARDYPDFDMQNDQYWYDEKDDGHFLTPCFQAPDLFGCPSEDKFITTTEVGNTFENPMAAYDKSEGYERNANTNFLDESYPLRRTYIDGQSEVQAMEDDFDISEQKQLIDNYLVSKEDMNVLALEGGIILDDYGSVRTTKKNQHYSDRVTQSGLTEVFESHSEIIQNVLEDYIDDREANKDADNINSSKDGNDVNTDELPIVDSQAGEYDVFDLRIIHRKNRTGFEENKDLPIVLNTVIGGRYYVTEFLGSAAFSKVVQAHDLHTGVDVCLKIIKNDKDFFDQSLDEIKLLKLVNKYDPNDERHILRLYDYFYHQEHLFLVCELLRANLYEFQKFNEESGGETYFTLSRLQIITRQCLEALEYLHDLGIIHCDLKPENILIKNYRRCEIKVIDLGSSCFLTDNLCMYVQSRSYRAPEVILGLPYDQKIDLWSLGCILAELYSGEVLFPNDAVVMILARMIGLLGPIDLDMLERGQESDKYFTNEYDLYYINEETNQAEYIIPEESSVEHHLQISDAGFINFLRNLLEVNPVRRLTATEALEHPWLSHVYESNSS